MRRFILVFCLIALPALAEPATHEEESPEAERAREQLRLAAQELGINLDPEIEPEGAGVTIRALDDSPPAMKQLAVAYLHAVPCEDETSAWNCDRAKKILRDGGDPLAHYLIRQVEENEREGSGKEIWEESLYINMLGWTESPAAYEYLRDRVFNLVAQYESRSYGPRHASRMRFAIEALGNTRVPAATDDAIALLERFPNDDEGIALRAVRIVEEVQAKHGPQPRAQEAVRAHQTRRAAKRVDREVGDDGDDDGYDRRIENALKPQGQPK